MDTNNLKPNDNNFNNGFYPSQEAGNVANSYGYNGNNNGYGNTHAKFNVAKNQTSSKSNTGFGKSVLIPFASGIIGAAIVVSACFGIPSLRNNIIGSKTSGTTSSSTSSTSGTQSAVSLANYSDTATKVASDVLPSIVGIKVNFTVNSIFGLSKDGEAEGSGIILSQDGYILTNNHVVNVNDSSSYLEVSGANSLKVYLYNDETAYDAKVIGTDSQTDLAVIKIDKTGLTPAAIGSSSGLKVGEFVMALGNPLGMQSSVTSGIVSALNRTIEGEDGKSYNLIQTDAAINSGNSGGALVNAEGKVIGINSMKLSGSGVEGMGFAIPIDSAKPIYEQLISNGKVARPYMGLSGRDLDETTAKANNLQPGVYVVSVEQFSAAEKAGIKAGDVITAFDGQAVSTMEELNNLKNNHKIGDEVTVKVNRNGKELELKVTLQEQPSSTTSSNNSSSSKK